MSQSQNNTKTTSESTVVKTMWGQAVASTETPIPAWSFAVGSFRPGTKGIVGFSLAQILGGYMIYDDDLINGAGFSSVWSALYLLAYGRPAVKSVRPLPLGLAAMAGFNAVYYGRHFFFPKNRASLPENGGI
ncbi:uncharacterized protein SAPINGB_P000980 [Magnusiomyces paraingens]|uniref:Uncharacterized protein n=1 Tax=Magnusiomyces paraingens TaxID=2606893 RepID=A0A5E8B3B4_9ASCO|nr:uncharacterized protein SAPINGB_P000980 [Saprochaete ingens]VVT45967.1 unnamed protein product [Saprochaete ingens]